jgi:2-polyprenyl-3-methyl-5-hydroxy-6-metoxy-1,4-benzoquinol methylase
MIALVKIPLPADISATVRRLYSRSRRTLTLSGRRLYDKVYYQLLFGLEIPFAPGLSRKLAALAMHEARGDAPVPGKIWEEQYRSGHWSFLREVDQMARYDVIAGYIESLMSRDASVLDVGCGEGLLLDRLRVAPYSRFVGIDISPTAVEQAREKRLPRSVFLCADAADFVVDEDFDVIIFNEVLYYFPDPLALTRKYYRRLKPDGLLITSFYGGSDRARAIAKALKKLYRSIAAVEINSREKSWLVDVFAAEKRGAVAPGEIYGS